MKNVLSTILWILVLIMRLGIFGLALYAFNKENYTVGFMLMSVLTLIYLESIWSDVFELKKTKSMLMVKFNISDEAQKKMKDCKISVDTTDEEKK